MKLFIFGRRGFRVPLVYRALLADRSPSRVTDVVLHGLDASRLAAVGGVLIELVADIPDAPTVTTSTDLDEALRGADFVFSAIRVGGLEGRAANECRVWVRRARQETVGLGRRVPRAAGVRLEDAWLDYAGSTTWGWLRGVQVDGRDVLPDLLADTERLESFEEGKLFGAEWLRTLGAIQNEYLHYYYYYYYYYYFTREAVESGAFLLEQQKQFYAAPSFESWDRTRLEREQTHMAETRDGDRDTRDLDGGGYEQVALDLMHAIASDNRTTLILNVPNQRTLSYLDAVVEVPSLVDANGARPVAVSRVPRRGRWTRHCFQGRRAAKALARSSTLASVRELSRSMTR